MAILLVVLEHPVWKQMQTTLNVNISLLMTSRKTIIYTVYAFPPKHFCGPHLIYFNPAFFVKMVVLEAQVRQRFESRQVIQREIRICHTSTVFRSIRARASVVSAIRFALNPMRTMGRFREIFRNDTDENLWSRGR